MQVNDANIRRRGMFLAALISLLLQLVVAPNLHILGGQPNFCLVFCAYIALTLGGAQGVICGFIAGLVFDLTSTSPVGLMALELTICAFLLGRELRNRLSDGFVVVMRLFVFAAFIVELVFGFAMVLTGTTQSFGTVALLRLVPSLVLDALFFALYVSFGPRISSTGPSFGIGTKLKPGSLGAHMGKDR